MHCSRSIVSSTPSGLEELDGTQAGAVGERGQHAKHTAEAVKQRHTQAQAVRRRVAKTFANPVAVVDDVPAREHHALGKARRARRVLHVDHVVHANARFALIEIGIGHRGGKLAELRVGHRIRRALLADEDHARHLRARLAELGHVVDALEAGDGHERRRFALAQQVLDLARTQRRIDGDEDRADLGERELQDDPFRNVGGPHGDAIAARDTGRDQAARDQPRFLLERAEGPDAGCGAGGRRAPRGRAAAWPAG